MRGGGDRVHLLTSSEDGVVGEDAIGLSRRVPGEEDEASSYLLHYHTVKASGGLLGEKREGGREGRRER